MGEGTTGLGDGRATATNGASGAAGSPRETVRLLEGQITALRVELSDLVAELDRRRREALDIKLQVRRHAGEITLTSAALVGAATGFVWLSIWRNRRRQRLGARVGRVQHTMSRMIAGPARVGAEPTIPMRIVAAAANAAAATLIRKVLERVVHHVMEHRRLAAADTRSPAPPLAQPKSHTAA